MPKTSVDSKLPQILTAAEASRPIPHVPAIRNPGGGGRWKSRTPKARPVRRWIDQSVIWTDAERAEAEATAEKPPAFLALGRWPEPKQELI